MDKPRFDEAEEQWLRTVSKPIAVERKPIMHDGQNRQQRRAFNSKVRKIIKKKVKAQNAKRKANSNHHDGATGIGEIDLGKDFY